MKKKMRLQIWLYASSPNDAVIMKWLQKLQRDKQNRPRVKDHVVAALVKAIEGDAVAEGNPSRPPAAHKKQPRDDAAGAENALPLRPSRAAEAFPDVQKIKF